ncbi:MAG: radical SAM protein [Smithella sp.]
MSYDVLLINPTRVGIDSYLTPPIHLMYLAKALIDAGHTYKIINVHEAFCRKAHVFENDVTAMKIKKALEEEYIDKILQYNAKLIGIGSVPPSYDFTEKLVLALKGKNNNTPIIVGGSLGLPLKDLWYKNTEIDFLCEGDGECLIVELLENLSTPDRWKKIPGLYWRTENGWRGNKPDLPINLDYIKAPLPDMVDFALYSNFYYQWINKTLPPQLRLQNSEIIWPVVLSRGCIYNCTFCFHFNRIHRRHSVEYIIDHLRTLKSKYGVTFVVTMDDLVMANRNWFMDLCRALEKEKLGIKIFTSGGKANLVDEEMATAMAKASFIRISYGIESGSQAILDEMQKQSTVEDNRRAVKFTTNAGIFVHLNIVIGMPGETKSTLDETKHFLIDVAKENNLSEENVSISFATPYPGTQLYNKAVQLGIIHDMRDYIMNVKGVGDPNPILCSLSKNALQSFPNLVRRQIINLRLKKEKHHIERLIRSIVLSRPITQVGRAILPTSVKRFVKKLISR